MRPKTTVRTRGRSGWVSVCRCLLLTGFFMQLTAIWALAVGEPPPPKLINVADTRNMAPGVSKWIADIYNGNLWLYGLTVVSIMAGMGYVLGSGFDRLMGLAGIHLGRLEHHE
jgi:hypothetical protein